MLWAKLPVEPPAIVGLVLYGPPATKLRARAGRGGHYTDPKTVAAEEMWLVAIRQTHRGIRPDGEHAFEVNLTFYLADYRRGDIDNFTKLVLDASNKVIFNDDQQVMRLVVDVFRGQKEPRTELVVSVLQRNWRNPARR